MHVIRKTGEFIIRFQGNRVYQPFIPKPLPPEPSIKFDTELSILLDKANRSLGKLDGVTSFLPNPKLFTTFYVMKEALLSSQIEGTHSTFTELLAIEPQENLYAPDAQEVINYISAFNYGMAQLNSSPNPKITLRLISEMHRLLLEKTKDDDGTVGEFRATQNWIGASLTRAKYVPPPPEYVLPCLDDLEKFLDNIPTRTPVIMKAALAHVQFETIHPFNNGNGRIGRLLIVLLLCMEKALSAPMLYISLYFKTNFEEYGERLQKVRKEGDWEGWLKFFFQGIFEVSQQAVETATAILNLFENDRNRIERLPQPKTPIKILSYLQHRPIVSIKELSKELKISVPSITHGLSHLEKAGIVFENTGYTRNRLFSYQQYINLLSEGTKPIEK